MERSFHNFTVVQPKIKDYRYTSTFVQFIDLAIYNPSICMSNHYYSIAHQE